MTAPVTIGDRVRERRLALGLTQPQVDRLTNSAATWCHKVENGHSFEPRSIDRVAEVLGTSVAWLRWGVHSALDSEELEVQSIVESLVRMSPTERSVMRSLVDSVLGVQRQSEAAHA